MLAVTINGRRRQFDNGTTILVACRQLGIELPTLCHDPRLHPSGACRLCVVDVKGAPRPLTACNTALTQGMEVCTHTAEIAELRRRLLELLGQDYPAELAERWPEKEFHRWLRVHGIRLGTRRLPVHALADERSQREALPLPRSLPAPFLDSSHPYIHVDMSQCIACYRCVRICDEVQGQFVWRPWNRGDATRILPDQ